MNLLDALIPRTITPRNARTITLMPIQKSATRYNNLTKEQQREYHRRRVEMSRARKAARNG